MSIATAVLAVSCVLPAAVAAQDVEPAPVEAEAPPDDAGDDARVTVRWEDGHLTFRSEYGSLQIANRIQFRWTGEWPEDDVTLLGTTEPGASRGTFRIRRAKTELAGWIWREALTYEVQIGWAAADSGPAFGTFSGLEDALVNWDASGDGRFQVRVGQFKVPFGRQEMTSSERLQFVDRDILSFEYSFSRDVGVMLWGRTDRRKWQYWAGVFNGNQRNRALNDNGRYQWNGRVTFQPWGDVGFSESDFESGDRVLLALSGQFQHNDFAGATNAIDFAVTTWGGDVVVKYAGASLFAEFFARDKDPETLGTPGAFEPSGPLPPSFSSNGWHAQAGYFLKRDVLELVARYATWDPTDLVAGNDRSEIGGGVNYYLNEHRLKVQGDVRQLEDDATDTTSTEVRVQLQVVF